MAEERSRRGLNPNARTFVPNPNAPSFTPGQRFIYMEPPPIHPQGPIPNFQRPYQPLFHLYNQYSVMPQQQFIIPPVNNHLPPYNLEPQKSGIF